MGRGSIFSNSIDKFVAQKKKATKETERPILSFILQMVGNEFK